MGSEIRGGMLAVDINLTFRRPLGAGGPHKATPPNGPCVNATARYRLGSRAHPPRDFTGGVAQPLLQDPRLSTGVTSEERDPGPAWASTV